MSDIPSLNVGHGLYQRTSHVLLLFLLMQETPEVDSPCQFLRANKLVPTSLRADNSQPESESI